MGRFFGRRPDPTPRIRRALRRRFLHPDEEVLAGVYLQRPGAGSLAGGGAGNAGVGASTGIFTASWGSKEEDRKWLTWEVDAAKVQAVDPLVAKRTIFLTLVLTSTRLLLVRRSRVLRGLHREVFASWLLSEVSAIELRRAANSLMVICGDDSLVFELPLGLKFLDSVYVELPALLDEVKNAARKK